MGEASSGSFLFLFLKERDGKREGTCFLAHREWGNTVFLGKTTKGKLWLVRVCDNFCSSLFSRKAPEGAGSRRLENGFLFSKLSH